MNLLTSDGFIVVNRELARDIGLNPAIFLYELIKQHIHYTKLGQTVSYDGKDGYFYETIENMHFWTTLSGREQEPCVKKLKELGFIEQIVKGLPAKRYFRVNEEKLLEYFSKSKSSFDKMSKLVPTFCEDLPQQKGKTRPYTEKRKEEEKRLIPNAVVVPVSLDKLKLSKSMKTKIAKEHSVADIDKAVERCLKWSGRPNDEAGIITALKKGEDWNDVTEPEDIDRKNREYLYALRKYDGKDVGGRNCVVGDYYIEFTAGQAYTRYETTEKDFVEKVQKWIPNAG